MATIFNRMQTASLFRALSLLLFFAGCLTYFFAQYGIAQQAQLEVNKRAVVTFQEVSVDSQGNKKTKAIIVSELNPEGGWVSKRYSSLSTKWTESSVNEHGYNAVTSDGRVIQNEGTAPNSELRKKMGTVEFYKSHPNYSGEDTILGYQAFKLRYNMSDGSWREKTFAPKIGAFRLKYIIHYPDGREIIQQATRIEFK